MPCNAYKNEEWESWGTDASHARWGLSVGSALVTPVSVLRPVSSVDWTPSPLHPFFWCKEHVFMFWAPETWEDLWDCWTCV